MEISVNKLENATVELTINVPADKINSQYDNVYKKIQKSVKIDGFRKGKAPLEMVKSKYKGEAERQVVEDTIRDTYYDALKEKELYPINNPEFDFDRLENDKDFTFKAKFEVRPTVELGDYKDIAVEEKTCKIAAKDVDSEIESLRERAATVSEKEKGLKIEKGDLVKISAELAEEGKDPEPFEVSIIAGQRKDDHEFDKYVVGMALDEEKSVSFKYPKDYHVEESAGKKVTHNIKVIEVNVRALPELDDEFAKDQNFESIEDMKSKIEERLVNYTVEKSKGDSKSAILEKVIESSKYEIPESIIEQEKMAIFQRMQQRMGVMVPEISKFAKTFGMEEEDFVNKMREEAIQSIKSTLTLAEISKVEDIKVTDEKFEEAVKNMAERSQKPAEEIKELIEKNNARSNIESEILFDSAMEFIYENAKIKKLSAVSFSDFVKPQA